LGIATTTEGDTDLAEPPDAGPPRRRHLAGLIAAAAVLLVVCALSLVVGTQNVGLPTVWRAHRLHRYG
jgi:uncharacterized RDD family membrane protein YckC